MPEVGTTRIAGACDICGAKSTDVYSETKGHDHRIIKEWTRIKHFDIHHGPCIQHLRQQVTDATEQIKDLQRAMVFLETQIKKLELSNPPKAMAAGVGLSVMNQEV